MDAPEDVLGTRELALRRLPLHRSGGAALWRAWPLRYLLYVSDLKNDSGSYLHAQPVWRERCQDGSDT